VQLQLRSFQAVPIAPRPTITVCVLILPYVVPSEIFHPR
jgi:hypothetical protein